MTVQLYYVVYHVIFSVASLEAGAILRACAVGPLFYALRLYLATVIGALAVFSLVALPVLVAMFACVSPLGVFW